MHRFSYCLYVDDPKRRDKSDRGDKADRSESMTGDWRAPREESSKPDRGYRDGKMMSYKVGSRHSRHFSYVVHDEGFLVIKDDVVCIVRQRMLRSYFMCDCLIPPPT